jgi:hypothetical protein
MASSTAFEICACETANFNVSFSLVDFRLRAEKGRREANSMVETRVRKVKVLSSKTRNKMVELANVSSDLADERECPVETQKMNLTRRFKARRLKLRSSIK